MFIWIVIIIIAISIGLSVLSLLQLRNREDMKKVKKELAKNRILFQDSSDS